MFTKPQHVYPQALARDEPIKLLVDPESLLIDTAPGIEHSLTATLKVLDLPLPHEGVGYYARMGKPLPEIVASLIGRADRATMTEFFATFVDDFHHEGRYRGRLRAGSGRLLASLAGDPRYDLHYLSHIGTEAAAKLLDHYGLQHHMRSIITTEAPSCPGQRLQLLSDTVSQSPAAPASWLLTSDHPWELAAAAKLGIRAIALGYGRAPLTLLVGSPAEVIAAGVGDVEAHLADRGQHENVVRMLPRSRRLH